jgi:hypothetical protein
MMLLGQQHLSGNISREKSLVMLACISGKEEGWSRADPRIGGSETLVIRGWGEVTTTDRRDRGRQLWIAGAGGA